MSDTKTKLEQIRSLLDDLEKGLADDDQLLFYHNFDALEIPSIVASIIDFLQPLLHPYEAAIYWYLFRKSILATGQQYTRAGTRTIQKSNVIQSSSGQSAILSYGTIQQALTGLEQKGVIIKAGEPNREGTLYKLNLPEEIEPKKCAKLEP
jgi:hypothetical protein